MTEMLPAILEGKIKALYIIGENPVISDADTDQVVNPLQHLDFLVVQDIFLTETGKLADVVLPASSFAEKDGTFTNTERRVARVRQAIPPVGDSTARLADHLRTLPASGLSHGLCRAPRRSLKRSAEVTPSYAGITYERLEAEGGPAVALPPSRSPRHPLSPPGPVRSGAGTVLPPLNTGSRRSCRMPSIPSS